MHIIWNLTTVLRSITIVGIAVTLYQFLVMLSHYWFRIIPLRKEISEEQVVAPPVMWTFAYHLIVMLIALFTGIGLLQAIYYQSRLTVFAVVSPVLYLSLAVVVNRFTTYYSKSLNDLYRRSTIPSQREETS